MTVTEPCQIRLARGGGVRYRNRVMTSFTDRVSRRTRERVRPVILFGVVLLLGSVVIPADAAADEAEAEAKNGGTEHAVDTGGEWKSMFDGKTIDGWKEAEFTGRGEVTVQDESIVLGMGFMTGVIWDRPFPTSNYEIRLEARRINGSDFFCALTFPVKDSHCTWINGGWGGGVVGLSSLDGFDASENETTQYFKFEKGKWYSFRLRVTDARIESWIDGKQVIDVKTEGRKIGLRFGEIELSVPLGFASWSTTAGLRKLEYRTLETDTDGDADEPNPPASGKSDVK